MGLDPTELVDFTPTCFPAGKNLMREKEHGEECPSKSGDRSENCALRT